MRFALAALLSFASLVAPPLDVVITLERTACYGWCPDYTVEIHGDGHVIYTGRNFVRITGMQRATVSRDAVRKLVEEFERANYFSMQDSYTTHATDNPTMITSIKIGERYKRVSHYIVGPEELDRLENDVDLTANSARWVYVDAAAVRQLQQAGWQADSQEGRTYLSHAVQFGNVAAADALIRAGLNVRDSPRLLADAPTREMVTFLIHHGCPFDDALATVIRWNKPDRFAALRAAGAPVNTAPTRHTPLMEAAEAGQTAIVETLLKAGANVNANDGTPGRATALMCAVWGEQRDIVAMLIEAGADVNAVDGNGRAVWYHAVRTSEMAGGRPTPDHVTIMNALRAAGAK